jgi:hypothetical protein
MSNDEHRFLNRGSSMPSKSYGFLLGLSKSLGTVATKSFVEVRDFLNHDVPIPSSERFFNNMPMLKHKNDDQDQGQHQRQGQSQSQSRSSTKDNGKDTTKTIEEKSSEEAATDKKVGTKKGQTEVDPTKKLEKIVKQSHDVLASANTVFPVTLFPDTVFVDRTKVTIIRRNFFWSADVMSIRIQDVLNVSASVGPLFGSLTLVSRVMSTVDHFQINYFSRSDATHLKHIIQGYVIAQHNKLDTAHLSKEELIATLEELGHDSHG